MDKFDGPKFGGTSIREERRGAYIGEENHFNLQSVKRITFFSFSSIKLVFRHISRRAKYKIEKTSAVFCKFLEIFTMRRF